jgi:hypothetical protein
MLQMKISYLQELSTEKQCVSVVYSLMQEIIDIKSSWPEVSNIQDHPKFKFWVKKLDKLTDQIMFAGGF